MRDWPRQTAIVFFPLCIAGCGSGPPPIVVHDEPSRGVWIQFDPHAGGEGHSHPATISPAQMATVLRGVRARGRDIVGGFGLLADKESVSAFLPVDIPVLASLFSIALSKASPKDIVTFYLVRNDLTRGRLITSGGLCVRDRYLIFILANAHTSPFSVQYENTSTIDTRDQPLLPIARFKFTAEFSPPDVRIPNRASPSGVRYEGYFDDSKLLTLDLSRLPAGGEEKPRSRQELPSSGSAVSR